MDAVEFIKWRNRMCKSYYIPWRGDCRDCPAKWVECSDIDSVDIEADKIVEIVEEWAAAHPRKTRQSVFWEQFPNAKIDKNGVIIIAPCTIEPEKYNAGECAKNKCVCDYDCRHGFWMQEVE